MRRVLVAVVLVVTSGWAEAEEATFYVDATAAPGGTGTRKAPFARIADAVDAGRPLAATHAVTIKVAPGEYLAEPKPISLDYPVTVKGSTVLLRDDEGIATGEVVETAVIKTVLARMQTIVRVSGPGISVRGLKLDGGAVPSAGFVDQTFGIAADKATDFDIRDVYVSGLQTAIIVSASTGRIDGIYAGPPLTTGVAVNGGGGDFPTNVRVSNNRVEGYITGGMGVNGASDPLPPREEPRHTVSVTFEGNRLHTNVPVAGNQPSNPLGFRFNTVFSPNSSEDTAEITAIVRNNMVSGTNRYALIINGGQIQRNGLRYHGTLDLTFQGNDFQVAPDGSTESRVLITLTNARMGIFPFWNELATTAQYLEHSLFRLTHDGDLDACLGPFSPDCHVDHPEIEPCDGRVLENVLEINGVEVPYGTFIPDVCP